MSRRAPVVCMLSPGGLEHAGGIGRWAGYFVEAWSKAGGARPEIVIVDTRGKGGKLAGIVAFLAALTRLAGFLVQGRLGLIHAHLSSRGSTTRKCIVTYLASLFGIPVILHLNGSNYDGYYLSLSPSRRRRVQRMFARAKCILLTGEVWRRFFIDQIGVDEGKLVCLYNGVPRPPAPVSASRADGPCRIVMLGRLGARKGVPELVAALGSAPLRERDWHATLAGDGDVEGTARQVAELGLTDRIALPGWIAADGASALLARADILVLASYAENMPVSVLEALSHGVAVITTPVGATPEILTDGVSALLVQPGDVAALAAALLRLVDEPALRARIAAAGHQVFEQSLDIVLAVDRVAALYRHFAPIFTTLGPGSGLVDQGSAEA